MGVGVYAMGATGLLNPIINKITTVNTTAGSQKKIGSELIFHAAAQRLSCCNGSIRNHRKIVAKHGTTQKTCPNEVKVCSTF